MIAIIWVVLAVAYIVRSAFVAAYAETDLKRAERLWPDHPSVVAGRAMIDVAGAAAAGRGLDSNTRELVADVARAEPLAHQPFLIAGAEALRNSKADQAERLLLSARQRDPRAPAPRLLLAEQYISQGRIREGAAEAAILGKLVPETYAPLAKAFANHIQMAGIRNGMRETLRSSPELSEGILDNLATDPMNADLLLLLSHVVPRKAAAAKPWQIRLISEVIEEGDYSRARQLWAELAGARLSETIYDPRFHGSSAPPPFNWTFATQGAVIEARSGGLHILYFGRDDGVLASQLLVLRPGTYGLRMTVSGQLADPQTLNWKISCLPSRSVILDRPVGQAGTLDWAVNVPSSGCGAQQLELHAKASDAERSSDFLISGLNLTAKARR